MPILSMFYGIVVRMFFRDNQRHHMPHFHRDELMADWGLAVAGEPVFKIKGLG